ncbi:MAG: DUF2341 domain-containing protein, partial [Nitrospirae bacterium]|nr:DUF2341 domain-containing protein [Nitrospirota bacterium]
MVLSASTVFAADWYSSSWSFRKKLTIQSSKVPGDLSYFPVLVSITLDTSKVQSDGDDILFTTSDGTTKLDHEIESYNSGTGALLAWVEVTSVSSSSNTDIYIYYGNSGAGNQQNVSGTWDEGGSSYYKGVWHLKEDPSGSAPQMTDSTSGSNNGTSNGSMTSGDQVAGQVNGSLDFDGSDDYIDAGSSSNIKPATALTVEAWVSRTGGLADWETVLATNSNDSWDDGYGISVFDTGVKINFWVNTWNQNVAVTSDWPTGWHYVVGTFEASTAVRIYLDGNEGTADTSSVPASITYDSHGTGKLFIGSGHQDTGSLYYFSGGIDEVRISNTVRSSDWITAAYNNQGSPGTFVDTSASEQSTFTWTGASSTDWNTAANWDVNAVPGAGHTAVIPDVSGGSNRFPVLGGATTVTNLTINSGATLTASGNSLTVSGTFSNDGTLYVT